MINPYIVLQKLKIYIYIYITTDNTMNYMFIYNTKQQFNKIVVQ